MPNKYSYIDPDHTYTDPVSGGPFREGNGRTQREFLRLLALEKGLDLNLNPPDDADVYTRYMSGTINGDIGTLAELILDIMQSA